MKKFYLIKILSFLLLTCGMTVHAEAEKNTPHEITMESISYKPKSLEIHLNDKVVWINKSYTDHSATSDQDGEFNTGFVHPKDKSKPISFPKAGTYTYHCSTHGKTMSGTIVVKP